MTLESVEPNRRQLPSVPEVIAAICQSFRQKEVVVFAGAGISFHSGVPMVSQLVPYLLEKLGLSEDVKTAVWNEVTGLQMPFEAFLEILQEHCDISQILSAFGGDGTQSDGIDPTIDHIFLAKLVKAGYLATIVTTNFDRLIERALQQEGMSAEEDYRLYYREEDLSRIDWAPESVRLVKIHGSIDDRESMVVTLRRIAGQLFSTSRKPVVDHVFSRGGHKKVLILGYSSSDFFDISPFIEALVENQKVVAYVEHSTVGASVEAISARETKNPFRLFADGYRIFCNTDELVRALWRNLFGEEWVEQSCAHSRRTLWRDSVDSWYSGLGDLRRRETISLMIAGKILFQGHNYDRARECLEKALEIGMPMNDIPLEGFLIGQIGHVAYLQGDKHTAHHYHCLALQISREIGDQSLEVRQLRELADVEVQYDDDYEAGRLRQQALQLAKEIGDRVEEAKILTILGTRCQTERKYVEAIDRYTYSLELLKKIGDKNGEISVACKLGSTCSGMGDLEAALQHYVYALKTSGDLGIRQSGRVDIYLALGAICEALDLVSDTIEYYQRALQSIREEGDKEGEVLLLPRLVFAHNRAGNQLLAQRYHEEAIEVAKARVAMQTSVSALCSIVGEYHKQAVRYAVESNEKLRFFEYLYNEYRLLGDLARAGESCRVAMATARELSFSKEEERFKRLLIGLRTDELWSRGRCAARRRTNMATIYHQVSINAPVAKVYEAISTTDGISTWWDKQTPVQTDRGLVLEHYPGPEHGVVQLRVVELVPDKRIEWECISTHPKSSPASVWTGTHFIFELADTGGATTVDFYQTGYDERSEFFEFNSSAWGQVLQNLKQVVESRHG
jgi:tetratricopeptide (TPR) repeat protein/uncharacterized protein YndB with AHSA1/START domain